MKKLLPWVVAATTMISLTACLKTRAQLREENESEQSIPQTQAAAGKPTPVKVQEVQPQASDLDEIKTEITRLNGRIEELERAHAQGAQNQSGTKELRDEQKRQDARIQELETSNAQLVETVQKLTAPVAAAKVGGTDAYEKAKVLFNAGDFTGAVDNLSAYLKNPRAQHYQEATFLRAEAYFNLKQYKKSIVDYSKFPEKFPTSKHTPASLYKIALSFENLGMKDDAKSFYQELAEKFPSTPEGKRAKAKAK